MGRKRSAETELRQVRRELKETRAALNSMRTDHIHSINTATILKAERDEWKRRFDALLNRLPNEVKP